MTHPDYRAQALLSLLERVEALAQQPTCADSAQVPPTPEAAPVVTDEELLKLWIEVDGCAAKARRACYNLGRQHGAAQPPAAQPAPPAPVVALHDALIKAECALSDIAEGEETNAAPSTFEWAEQRCAETLAIIRPVMKQHKIRTSEWPPTPQPPAAPPAGSLVEKALAKTTAILNDPGRVFLTEVRETLELNLCALEQFSAPTPPPAPAGGLVERVAELREKFEQLIKCSRAYDGYSTMTPVELADRLIDAVLKLEADR